MKLKDLPQPIRELAEKRVREQGNEPDGEKDLTNDKQIGGFDWHKTQEGDYFWEEISKSNFTPFYERYPEAKQVHNMTGASNPNHHYKQTNIEPITVIQDWKLSFCLGNVVKYIGRADHKGNKLADLEKAADYLRMEIETLKTK